MPLSILRRYHPWNAESAAVPDTTASPWFLPRFAGAGMRRHDQCRAVRDCVKQGDTTRPFADAASSSMSKTCVQSSAGVLRHNEGGIPQTTFLGSQQCQTDGASASFQSCVRTPQQRRERRQSDPEIQSRTRGRCPWCSLPNHRWALLTQQLCVEESRGHAQRKRGAGSATQR